MTIRSRKKLAVLTVLFLFSNSFAQTKPTAPAKSAPAKPAASKQKTVKDAEEAEIPPQTGPAPGAKIYTLSEAIAQSLTVAPMVTSAIEDKAISEGQLQEANNARFLPSIDLRVIGGLTPDIPDGSGPEANFPEVDTSIRNVGPFGQVQVEAFQPIYTFGKIANLRKAALEGVSAKEQGVNKAKNDLVLLVKKAYVGLTALYSFKDFLTDLQSRAVSAKGIIDKMMQKKGSGITDIDLMRIDVFQAETDRRLIEIDNGINFLQTTLKVLMGLPRDANIDIADRVLRMDTTVIAPIESYLNVAKTNRPEINQLQNLVEVREAMMNVAKTSYYPVFGAAGFYRYGIAPDRQHVNNPFLVDNFNYNTGGGFLVLSQSLSFHMTNSRVRQAKAQYDKAIADQQRALQGIELEIRKAHNNAMTKQQAVEAAKRGFKSGRSWVLAASLNLGVGLIQPRDLLEAFVGYSTVKINYLQTLNDYYLSLADLSNAIGQEVTNLKY